MKNIVILLSIVVILFIGFNDIEFFRGGHRGHRGHWGGHRRGHRRGHRGHMRGYRRGYGRGRFNYPLYNSYVVPTRINYNPFYYDYLPKWLYNPVNIPVVLNNNPGCDNKSCGGYCTPYNSKCCGGTNPSTCSRRYCQNSNLCN
jgi:hypothetical protein